MHFLPDLLRDPKQRQRHWMSVVLSCSARTEVGAEHEAEGLRHPYTDVYKKTIQKLRQLSHHGRQRMTVVSRHLRFYTQKKKKKQQL